MEVAAGLHRVEGIGDMVNAFVWERPDGGLTLIDAGIPSAAPAILSFLDRLGRGRTDRIIITHADFDHAGGVAAVKAATGAQVICHAVEKAYLEQSQRRPTPRHPVARLVFPMLGLAQGLMRYEPVGADVLVLDQEELPEGFQVIHVPGHSPGQIALWQPAEGILIVGDALFNRGGRLTVSAPILTSDVGAARESVRKLARLRGVRVICCGHGQPLIKDAETRLQALAASL